MPNHTTNELTVVHKKDGSKVMHVDDPKLRDLLESFSLDKVIPMPEQLKGTTSPSDQPNWYDWSVDNWGTKWDVYATYNTEANDDETINLFSTDGQIYTAWAPPIPVIRKLQKDFPEYEFTLEYVDEGWCFAGNLMADGTDLCLTDEKEVIKYALRLGATTEEEIKEMQATA